MGWCGLPTGLQPACASNALDYGIDLSSRMLPSTVRAVLACEVVLIQGPEGPYTASCVAGSNPIGAATADLLHCPRL